MDARVNGAALRTVARLSEGFCPIPAHGHLIGGKAAVEAGAVYYTPEEGCQCENSDCGLGVATEEKNMPMTYCRDCSGFWEIGTADRDNVDGASPEEAGNPVVWFTVTESPAHIEGLGLLKIQCGRGIPFESLYKDESIDRLEHFVIHTHAESLLATLKNVAEAME